MQFPKQFQVRESVPSPINLYSTSPPLTQKSTQYISTYQPLLAQTHPTPTYTAPSPPPGPFPGGSKSLYVSGGGGQTKSPAAIGETSISFLISENEHLRGSLSELSAQLSSLPSLKAEIKHLTREMQYYQELHREAKKELEERTERAFETEAALREVHFLRAEVQAKQIRANQMEKRAREWEILAARPGLQKEESALDGQEAKEAERYYAKVSDWGLLDRKYWSWRKNIRMS